MRKPFSADWYMVGHVSGYPYAVSVCDVKMHLSGMCWKFFFIR